MKFFSQFIVIAFGLAQTTLSSALKRRTASSKECAVVNEIVDLLKLVKATPFCSSFLSIPVTTVISTISTSKTVVVTTSPYTFTTLTLDTATIINTITDTSTTATISPIVSTFTTYVTSTVTSIVTSVVTATPVAKRNVEERGSLQIPPYLAEFASAEISTACSCLSIPQSTSLRTTTVIATVPSTAISSVAETQTTQTLTTTTTTVLTELVVPETVTATISETTTVTSTTVATVCPNPIQNPGFETDSAVPWTVTTSDLTGREDYGNPGLVHSGKYAYLFDYLGESDGPLRFSLSQQVTVNTCLPEQPVLSFWANHQTEEDSTCKIQACIGSTCVILNVLQSSGTGPNGFVQYSITGTTITSSSTVEISVSSNGGSEGNCVGSSILFDDFSLS